MFSKKITDSAGVKSGFCFFAVGRHTIVEVDARGACVSDGIRFEVSHQYSFPSHSRLKSRSLCTLSCVSLSVEVVHVNPVIRCCAVLILICSHKDVFIREWEVSAVWIYITNSIL